MIYRVPNLAVFNIFSKCYLRRRWQKENYVDIKATKGIKNVRKKSL